MLAAKIQRNKQELLARQKAAEAKAKAEEGARLAVRKGRYIHLTYKVR